MGPNKKYGHNYTTKNRNDKRIVGFNVRSFHKQFNTSRRNKLSKFLSDLAPDSLGLMETDTYWPSLPVEERLYETTFPWFKRQTIETAYNIHSHKEKFQPGGCAQLTVNELAGRKIQSGNDSRGLGRWTWQVLRGKNQQHIRIITAYNAQKPTTKSGETTAYTQQLQYFRKQKIMECPMKMFIDDLIKSIQQWIESGDKIILLIDANTDVHQHSSQGLVYRLKRLGLMEVITSVHEGRPPETCHPGSKPIDGIFVSRSINITKCGYTKYYDFLSNHRAVWLDLDEYSTFGGSALTIPPQLLEGSN